MNTLKFVTIIHPECEIEDKRIIFLVELIEISERVPTKIDRAKNLDILVKYLILINIKIGMVFCQDKKIINGLNVNEFPIFKIHR